MELSSHIHLWLGGISITLVALGFLSGYWLQGAAAASMGAGLSVLRSPRRDSRKQGTARTEQSGTAEYEEYIASETLSTPDAPLQRMLADGRAAVVLKPLVAEAVDRLSLESAKKALSEQMAFVVAGRVNLPSWMRVAEHRKECPQITLPVGDFWIDRTPVTNEQFARFLRGGGYEQASFWHKEAWAFVDQFIDQTGATGPRFWNAGRYRKGEGDHPVVGVCWYEAAAYANWSGKRLPTDPEWLRAASWPVDTSSEESDDAPRPVVQRRFPWGDSLQKENAHLWSSRSQQPTAVSQNASGQNPIGIAHLVGNVWEWMRDDFGRWDPHFPLDDGGLASIRGGAFDTYFDNQAAAAFFSGEQRLARRPNIGFRCVVGADQLAMRERFGGRGAASDSTESVGDGEVPV